MKNLFGIFNQKIIMREYEQDIIFYGIVRNKEKLKLELEFYRLSISQLNYMLNNLNEIHIPWCMKEKHISKIIKEIIDIKLVEKAI